MVKMNAKEQNFSFTFHGEYNPYLHNGKSYTFYQKGTFESIKTLTELKKIKMGRGKYELEGNKLILTYEAFVLDTAELSVKTTREKPTYIDLKCSDIASKESVGSFNYQLIDNHGIILRSGIVRFDSSLVIDADLFSIIRYIKLNQEEYPSLTLSSGLWGNSNVEEIHVTWKNLNTEFETAHFETYHIVNISQSALTVDSFDLVNYYGDGKAVTWKRSPFKFIPFELWKKE